MPTPVVTCFLRHRDDVLLLRRSDAVGSYPGRWGGVAGHVAPSRDASPDARSPEAAARAEIAEETKLLGACELVRAGEPFVVAAPDREADWLVHPFLFDCERRDATVDEETAETAWVPPPELLRRPTVPQLWQSYDRVRPTLATVGADESHGSAYLSVRALDVLRDRAAGLAAGAADPNAETATAELADLATALQDARPGMAALRNRVNRAMAAAADGSPAAVESAAQAEIDRALGADDAAAERAAALLDGEGVLTLSRSGTVLAALRAGNPERVVVAASRPGGEGVGVAAALSEVVTVTLCPDAAVAHLLAEEDIDRVLVGADTVLADGRVVNKVGTRSTAVAAAREGVPVHVVAARDKVAPGTEVWPEQADPSLVYDGEATVGVDAPLFDVTPADLVTGVVTEDGVLDAAGVAAVADEHRALADR